LSQGLFFVGTTDELESSLLSNPIVLYLHPPLPKAVVVPPGFRVDCKEKDRLFLPSLVEKIALLIRVIISH
jgi:hypothetical protein